MTDWFDQLQREHSSAPEIARYRWQTGQPRIRQLEERLLGPIFEGVPADTRLLEVGCGEGANLVTLVRLGFRGDYVGIDASGGKVAFAIREHPGRNQHFLVADAVQLPFPDRAFASVLCRDVLHHVSRRASLVAELTRVAAERIVLIEPNPFSWLIAGFGLLDRAERGMFRSTPASLDRLIAQVAPSWRVTRHWAEPSPLARLALHYRFGVPALGRSPFVDRALGALDRVTELGPHALWAYQVLVLEAA